MSEGKKINELNSISTLTDQTVFPAVYINNNTVSAVAGKISLSQFKEYIEQGVYTQEQINSLLNGKQDVLTAGEGITIEDNIISASNTGGGILGIFTTTSPISAPSDMPSASQNEGKLAVIKYNKLEQDSIVFSVKNLVISNGSTWEILPGSCAFADYADEYEIQQAKTLYGITLKNGDPIIFISLQGLGIEGQSGTIRKHWYLYEDSQEGWFSSDISAESPFYLTTGNPENPINPGNNSLEYRDYTNSNVSEIIMQLWGSDIHAFQADIKAGSYDLPISIVNGENEPFIVKYFINGEYTTNPELKAESFSHILLNGSQYDDGSYTVGNALYCEIFTTVGNNVWTTNNLVAGNNIAIQQAQQPIIDSNTLGVFHFEGNNNNAVTGASLAITPEVSGGGTLSISSAQHKFGEESTNFVCTSSSAYGTLFASDALSFAQGQDFTIDFWAKWSSASYGVIYPFYVSSSSLYGFGVYSGYFRVFNAGSQTSPSNVPAGFNLSNWNHFAIERVGNTINWYTDGVKIYSANQSSEAKVQMRILDGSTSNVIYVDELRVSNVARYNGNSYTVNTQPYSYGEIKYKIDVDLTSVSGYSSSGTQVLKNINGILTWVTES